MANNFIQVPPDSTGKKIDAASLDVGVDAVLRQRIIISDNINAANFAAISNSALNVNVTSSVPVAISGTAIVAYATPPTIQAISATVTVQGNVNISAAVALAAGTANIGAVSLAAGTANIGFINNISAPVALAAGTANIGYINHISATLIATLIAGTANIGAVSLAAGTSNIGFINSISKTVDVAIASTVTTQWGSPQVVNNISATVVTGLSYVIEKTTNSQVQVGDSANAAIRVSIVSGAVGGAGGTSQTDGTSFDTQTATFTPIGGIFDDASTNSLSENDAGIVRLTSLRAFHSNLRTDGGVKMDDSTNSALRVNVVAGSAGGPSSNDNTTYSTGATAVAPAGYIFFSASATTMTDGRVGAARITDSRAVHSNLRNNAGTEIGTNTTPLSVKVENTSATASVILAAGAANIGTINDISKTVSVVVAAGTANMGAVSLAAGTANIGFINNISATVNVAFAGGISLAAGTANIGFINGISATISVVNAAGTALMGAVSLAAGTANIGFINNISATVNTVIGAGTSNIGFINNISATVSVVIAAGTANIGTLNNISKTVDIMVCGFKDNSGNIQTGIIDSVNGALKVCGTGALGSIAISSFVDPSGTAKNLVDSPNLALRVSIQGGSATLNVTTSNPWVVNLRSASHGPKMVQLSTSATATLIAAPGAGLHIYVTSLAVSNIGTVNTAAKIGGSDSIGLVTMIAAANGGGFVMNFDPPWKVESNGPVNCCVKPNSSGNVFFNCNFFVAA